MNIMIVEDQRLIALALEDMLTKAGHSVVGIVATAEQAIKLAAQIRPDAAFIDLHLAKNSNGVFAAIHMSGRLGVTCLMVSGHCSEAELAGENYALGCLQKPFTEEDILAAVAAIEATRQGEPVAAQPRNLRLFRAAA